jgi:hypothetical protein
MNDLVDYEIRDGVAVVTLMSPPEILPRIFRL